MAYGQGLEGAARRHLAAAHRLYADTRPGHSVGSKAVAGYLYGLAGELALKELMRSSGIKPLDASRRRDDPYYAHFPLLKTLLRNNAQGRLQSKLLTYANNDWLFKDWDTDMRYAPTSDIRQAWTECWRSQAEALVDEMNAW